MNTFGQKLRLTTFGESHGSAIGGIVDGFPSGIAVDAELVQSFMESRRPGRSSMMSQRREADKVQILSGVAESGLSLGTPIGFVIANSDVRSKDYESLRHVYRPNHADYTYDAKYGIREYRGGGRASARETAVRVAAAAIVYPLLLKNGITVTAALESVGGNPVEVADEVIAKVMSSGDSVGATVKCEVLNLPAGVGEPIFDKLQARLAYAMLSIPAVKGFEYGDGFEAAKMRGSECVDVFTSDADGNVLTLSNHSGGIQGGISNGMPITMRVAFKPTPSISIPQPTITDDKRAIEVCTTGRHDPCVGVRGVSVVRSMTILTIADMLLQSGIK